MHSSTVRLQNVFSFFTTIAACVALLTALSVFIYPVSPTANVDVLAVKIARGRPSYYSSKQQEYAFVKFDLDADLSSLYNWNTKQVFCWLSVVYGGGRGTKHTDNEVIIWDAIIPQGASPHLSLRNKKAKYDFNDIAGKFLERNATVRFGWNVQPHVGALRWGSVEVPTLEEVDLEKAEGKRGEGWEFAFPPIGGKKKAPVKAKATPAA